MFFVLITGANIAWIVMMFINFGSLEGCTTNLVVLIITAVASVIMQGVVCLGLRNDASVFTSALVTLYCLFLQWSALSSNPDAECNPYEDSTGNATARLTINLIITFIAMFTAAATVEDELPAAIPDASEKAQAIQEPFLDKEGGVADSSKTVPEGEAKIVETKKDAVSDNSAIAVSKQSIMFQVLFVLASIYYAMLTTNWGSPDTLTEGTELFGTSSKMAYWV